jgi:hypothetical protein
MSLLQHLMGLATSGVPWSYVQTEIEHHVDEMSTIRAIADTRLQAFVQLYCYLRDGHAESWQSTSLQSQRNVDLYTRDRPTITDSPWIAGATGGSDEGGGGGVQQVWYPHPREQPQALPLCWKNEK